MFMRLGPKGPLDCWFVEALGACGPLVCWFVEAGTRVGAYCIRPTGRHRRWRIHVPGGDHSAPSGPFGGAYAIRPYRGTCIRVPSGTRPDSLASADARPYTGTVIRPDGAGTRPDSPASADAPGQIRRCPQTPQNSEQYFSIIDQRRGSSTVRMMRACWLPTGWLESKARA